MKWSVRFVGGEQINIQIEDYYTFMTNTKPTSLFRGLLTLVFQAGSARNLNLIDSNESNIFRHFFLLWTVIFPKPLELLTYIQDRELSLNISYHLVLIYHIISCYFSYGWEFCLHQPLLFIRSRHQCFGGRSLKADELDCCSAAFKALKKKIPKDEMEKVQEFHLSYKIRPNKSPITNWTNRHCWHSGAIYQNIKGTKAKESSLSCHHPAPSCPVRQDIFDRAVTCSRNSGVLPNSEFFRK